MLEIPRRGRQARNFTANVPKILDLKSSLRRDIFRKLTLVAPVGTEWPIGIIDMRKREVTGQLVRSLFFEFPIIHSVCPLNFV